MTEYRIIPCRTFIGDLYLQFKRTRKVRTFFGLGKEKEISEWCFIPSDDYPMVFGYWLTADSCPVRLPFHSESNFLHCFDEQESYELIPFTKKYPDVELYFEHLRILEKHTLKTKREKIKIEK